MVENIDSPPTRSEAIAGYVVWAVAVAIALVSARDYAGGWNDGSRLATVECLVDHHTLAIDKSIFVDVPRIDPQSDRPFPYPLDDPAAFIGGTKDKVLVAGRYYSHKPPMPRPKAYEILCEMRGKLEAPLVGAFREVALVL